VILYAGFIRPAKRLEVLIDAVPQLLREGRRIKVKIAGPGDPPAFLDALKQLVISRGLDKHVEFLGYVPLGEPLLTVYREADIYVCPSATDGAARTLLEAASQSLPSVLTDVGTARDLFPDQEAALIVPPNEAGALANAIGRFIDDGSLRRHCIAGAYKVATRYTCGSFAEEVVQHLRAAHERANPRAPRRLAA
jgi:mannosyltransferase